MLIMYEVIDEGFCFYSLFVSFNGKSWNVKVSLNLYEKLVVLFFHTVSHDLLEWDQFQFRRLVYFFLLQELLNKSSNDVEINLWKVVIYYEIVHQSHKFALRTRDSNEPKINKLWIDFFFMFYVKIHFENCNYGWIFCWQRITLRKQLKFIFFKKKLCKLINLFL